jgi:hypothetical protein
MRRSSKGSRRRLRTWKSSAPAAPPPTGTDTAPAALTAVPDRSRSLSAGILIQGSVLARVLGVRLLTLDTHVVLMPADVTSARSAPRKNPRAHLATKRSWDPTACASARPSKDVSVCAVARPDSVAPRWSRPAGRSLAEAVRSINEGAQLLTEVRSDGP